MSIRVRFPDRHEAHLTLDGVCEAAGRLGADEELVVIFGCMGYHYRANKGGGFTVTSSGVSRTERQVPAKNIMADISLLALMYAGMPRLCYKD